ncbi:Elongation factor Ts, mitochondrial [Coemansia javaensis]|uniref:Elongation factor Ts, mitochondrial n=1 Tax=Coemansia javaensis TaxID=2761396 RepID=A0A9W8LIP6_9FUNG|nr:Elongation factor Ts, mitochondrial [Coemansia javaensis]
MWAARATARRLLAARAYATKVDIGALRRLRQLNPVPLGKAKEALLSSDNDVDRALAWLESDAVAAGAQRAAKVRGRAAREGGVAVHVNGERTAAAIVEVLCETDFVARNAAFVDLAAGIARAAVRFAGRAGAEIDVGRLAAAAAAAAGALESRTVGEAVTEGIGRLGENIVLRRAAAVGAAGGAGADVTVGGYVHGAVAGSDGAAAAGKIGAVVAVRSAARSAEHRAALGRLAARLAQQVVGFAPRFVTRAEWERAGSPGPETAALEAQEFLFGGGTVAEALARLSRELAAPVEVASFVRLERGEGIEKPPQPDFASEVRQQLQQ